MKTFENLIPELHKKLYEKHHTDQNISFYKHIRYSLSATVILNHQTGEVIFTFYYIPIIPFKLERDPIPNADQKADDVISELETFNKMSYAAIRRLTKCNTQRHKQ